ncbi:MAG: hypothetical protein JWQ49_1724 [Edaphobacter sp.]|nr:hypothetical protein [Edaphobacter sp.]
MSSPLLAAHRRVLSRRARHCLFERIRSLFEREDRRLARLESILGDYPLISATESLEVAHLIAWRAKA